MLNAPVAFALFFAINEEMRLRYNVVYDAERVFLIYADTKADDSVLTHIIITINKIVIKRGII